MEKLADLQKDIEALKKAINNPNNTNPQAKASMEGVLAKLEAKAKTLASSSPAGKTYEEELARQRATGEAKNEGISLYAMGEAMKNKVTPAKASPKSMSLKDYAKEIGIEVTEMDKPISKLIPKTSKEVKEPIKAVKKSVPLAKYSRDGYDCDELIDKAIERKKKAKERANAPQKTEVTKNKEKIDKVITNVKERAETDDISMSELQKLIEETEQLLNLLKSRLSKLK